MRPREKQRHLERQRHVDAHIQWISLTIATALCAAVVIGIFTLAKYIIGG